MSTLLLIPPLLSLLLLAAHSLRVGVPALMAIPIAVLILLAWPRWWAARVAQVTLVLGAGEWVRAALVYIAARQESGMDWHRLALILGGVALFTLLSAVVFQSSTLRRRYRLD